MNYISNDDLLFIRKEKIRKEILSAKKILQNGRDPLKIADNFINNSFKLIQDSNKKRFPNLSKQELSDKIRSNIEFLNKINQKRKVTKIGRIKKYFKKN